MLACCIYEYVHTVVATVRVVMMMMRDSLLLYKKLMPLTMLMLQLTVGR